MVEMISSFTSLDSTALLHINNILVKYSLFKMETSQTVILPSMVSVLWQYLTENICPGAKAVLWYKICQVNFFL